MVAEYIILIGGFLAILILADLMVRSVLRLAKHFNVSGTFVGLTVLSIGTSIPEIMSAIVGSINILNNPGLFQTMSGLIVGQNIGSDIFQQSFILAFVGIVGTIIVVKKDILKEVGALIGGAVLMWLFALGGLINRIEGFLMLCAYAAYLFYLYKYKKKGKNYKKYNLSKQRILLESLGIIIGFGIMGFVADKVLNVATEIVSVTSLSASFLGVIILGVASALPELTTALVGIIKKERGISAGVLIGSNITNPMMGLGLGALISTYKIPNVVLYFDLPFKIGTALLIFYFLMRNEKLNKWEAAVLIALFITYIILRKTFFPIDF